MDGPNVVIFWTHLLLNCVTTRMMRCMLRRCAAVAANFRDSTGLGRVRHPVNRLCILTNQRRQTKEDRVYFLA